MFRTLTIGLVACQLAYASTTTHAQNPFRRIRTIAGSGESMPFREKGLAEELAVSNPFGIVQQQSGNLLILSYDQHVLYELDSGYRQLEVIAGTGEPGLKKDEQKHASQAMLRNPHEVCLDDAGNIYVADTLNHRVGVIDHATKRWRTIAGTGQAGFSGDEGPANRAQFHDTYSIGIDQDQLFIADLKNSRVRQVNLTTGVVRTIAGNGKKGLPAEGALAVEQPLAGPRSLAVDARNVWLVLREGHSIWRIDRAAGTIHHVAGTGKRGIQGDGGDATKAQLNGPKGITLASENGETTKLYVADTENHAIRQITLDSGVITTVAGQLGKKGFNGDGDDPAQRLLNRPHGVCWLPDGELLIGDSENHRVRLLIE